MKRPLHRILASATVLPLALALAGPLAAQTSPVFGKQPPAHFHPGPPLAAGAAPPGPVHCIAEWEEAEGVMLRWKNADLVRKLLQDTRVYIPVNSAADQTGYINWLGNHGIPLTGITFLDIKTNSMYTRDYGPWFIWDANGDLGIVNYTCEYGYQDDLFPERFATMFGIDFYESGLYLVGGNYLPNGYDIAISSTHVYEANGQSTKAAVDEAMETFYGIDPYRTVAPKTVWHHDTFGKPCTPEKMIVVDYPENKPYWHRVANDAVAYYETLENPWGRPYEIFRLPMFKKGGSGGFRPYMNSLVSNRKVYVPVDGVAPDDRIAIGVFQQAFPGYEVVAVNSQGCLHYDALHCRTRNFHRRDPIRIYPYPPQDTEDTFLGYEVTAEVIPPRGAALLAGYPAVQWSTTGGTPFTMLPMTPTGTPDLYAAVIPAQPLGTTVSLYIEAQDDGGRTSIYPLVAPDGMMDFEVRKDLEAPQLTRLQPARAVAAACWPPTIRTLAKDDMATPEVWLEYELNGVPQAPETLPREEQCYWYSGAPSVLAGAGDLLTYRIGATDNATSPHTSYLPKVGRVYCPVDDSTEVAVVNLCSRPYTAPFLVESLGELGVPYTAYESWPTDWSAHEIWFICLGVFADNHVLSTSEANDITGALRGGARIYLEGGDTWCYDPERVTLNPWFGVNDHARGPGPNKIDGTSGSAMDGLSLIYVSENLFVDRISAVAPASAIFDNGSATHGRAVWQDWGGRYRTIASTFALGGLLDTEWPNTRKEILARYLEFLGAADIELVAGRAGHLGSTVPIRLEGQPGESYVLLASLGDYWSEVPGVGTLRLDPIHTERLEIGVIPASGVVEHSLRMPIDEAYLGYQVHLQALTGSTLTNRDVVTIVE